MTKPGVTRLQTPRKNKAFWIEQGRVEAFSEVLDCLDEGGEAATRRLCIQSGGAPTPDDNVTSLEGRRR